MNPLHRAGCCVWFRHKCVTALKVKRGAAKRRGCAGPRLSEAGRQAGLWRGPRTGRCQGCNHTSFHTHPDPIPPTTPQANAPQHREVVREQLQRDDVDDGLQRIYHLCHGRGCTAQGSRGKGFGNWGGSTGCSGAGLPLGCSASTTCTVEVTCKGTGVVDAAVGRERGATATGRRPGRRAGGRAGRQAGCGLDQHWHAHSCAAAACSPNDSGEGRTLACGTRMRVQRLPAEHRSSKSAPGKSPGVSFFSHRQQWASGGDRTRQQPSQAKALGPQRCSPLAFARAPAPRLACVPLVAHHQQGSAASQQLLNHRQHLEVHGILGGDDCGGWQDRQGDRWVG